MIQAAGIDLGGSKSEVQLFDRDWQLVDRRRDETSASYPDLIALLSDQIAWTQRQAGTPVPIGLGAAGLLSPDGTNFAANLPSTGKPLLADLRKASGHRVTYTNDCQAVALSESRFGVGAGHQQVMALILGTGVGGATVTHGRLRAGAVGTGGEFGHIPASAAVVREFGLPIFPCGCGRQGCVETYISGPGLSRLAETLIGRTFTPCEIATLHATDPQAALVWRAWTEMTADLLVSLVQINDPDLIVLAGGLSQMPGVIEALTKAFEARQFCGFGNPKLVLAEGGDASGARGAAYAAFLDTPRHA